MLVRLDLVKLAVKAFSTEALNATFALGNPKFFCDFHGNAILKCKQQETFEVHEKTQLKS